jgi:CDP-glucose 4,6-dehydratase
VPQLRNPGSLRPWQHVLEPLSGYLWLAARMASPQGEQLAQAWNFGPSETEMHDVAALADALLSALGRPGWQELGNETAPHEAGLLRLAIGKAARGLDWRPVWTFTEMARRTAQAYAAIANGEDARSVCTDDIDAWCNAAASLGLPLAK